MAVTAVSPKLTLVDICEDRKKVTGGSGVEAGQQGTAPPPGPGLRVRASGAEREDSAAVGGGGARTLLGEGWPRKPPPHSSSFHLHPEPRRKTLKPKRYDSQQPCSSLK